MPLDYPFKQNRREFDGCISLELRDDIWIFKTNQVIDNSRLHNWCFSCYGHMVLNHHHIPDKEFKPIKSSQPCDRCGALPRQSAFYYLGTHYGNIRKIITTSGGKFTRSDGLTFRIRDNLYQSL